MNIPIIQALRGGAAKIQRYLERRVLILLYHRVADADLDPWALAVSPDNFAEHLQVLRRHGRVMGLGDLAAALVEGKLPRRAIVVTFDDGYADNLINAKPLLEEFDVPATVFVASGYIGEDREFWWDELEKLFLRPGNLPRTLNLTANNKKARWELGETAEYELNSHRRNLGWRAWEQEDPSTRHTVYRSVWQMMLGMPENERNNLRAELLDWAAATQSARPTHRAMSAAEIRDLVQGGLIEAGCHTTTHPMLSALGENAQREEIYGAKARLEEIVDRPVSRFAYPYGRPSDYTGYTVTLVREAGFDCACSTTRGMVGTRSDQFQLPRMQIENMNGDAFDRLLSRSLHD